MITKLSGKEIWSGFMRVISNRAFVRHEVRLPLYYIHFEITQLNRLVV